MKYRFKVTDIQRASYDAVIEADSLNEARAIASQGRGSRLLKSIKRVKSTARLVKEK
jgi:hypothetical protein